jgi:hypothetical protein
VVLWLINCAYSTPSDYKTQHPDRNLKYKKPLLETAGYWSGLQVLDGDSAREDEEVERAATPLPPNMICLGDFRVTCGKHVGDSCWIREKSVLKNLCWVCTAHNRRMDTRYRC